MKNLILIFSLLFATISFAGNGDKPTEWTVYSTVDGIKISYKYSDCHWNNAPDKQRVLLKFENTTDKALSLSWIVNAWYGDECQNCNSTDPEHQRIVELKPNATIEGACTQGKNTGLFVFSDFLTYEFKTPLTRFELENIKVNLIKTSSK